MTANMTDRILPAEALTQLDQRDRQLGDVLIKLDTLRDLVEEAAAKDTRKITVADTMLAADLHRDLSQIIAAVRELSEEPRK